MEKLKEKKMVWHLSEHISIHTYYNKFISHFSPHLSQEVDSCGHISIQFKCVTNSKKTSFIKVYSQQHRHFLIKYILAEYILKWQELH